MRSFRAWQAPLAGLAVAALAGAAFAAALAAGFPPLLAGAAAAVAGTLSGWWLGRRTNAAFRRLEEGLEAVARGEYGRRVSFRRADGLSRLSTAFNRMAETLEEREGVRGAMYKVLSREVADELLKGEIKLGGEVRFSTVLFSDIQGFSGIAEAMEPQHLVAFLNEYLTLMSRLVEKNRGVIDKYIGDSIMALFGAPVARDNDVDNALQTAQDMVLALKAFNYRRAWEHLPPVSIGIGINTGPVIAGNMGSEDRLNYTVMGDSVNLASRLEGLTRVYHVNCLVSEFTHRESRKGFTFRELDMVRVKGRSAAVRLFELWDRQGDPGLVSEILQKFQNARQFYLLRDWQRAETLFRQVLELCPGDGPSQLYLSRLRQLREAPPPDSWDGVYTALSK